MQKNGDGPNLELETAGLSASGDILLVDGELSARVDELSARVEELSA